MMSKNNKIILLSAVISLIYFFNILAVSTTACYFYKPELINNNAYGEIAPQKLLTIQLNVYGDNIGENCTVYAYSSASVNITPTEQQKFVPKYEIIPFDFKIFFNYSKDVEYFEVSIDFYLYSHARHKVVDTYSYKAVYGDNSDIQVNVNNSLVFTMEQAGILKMIAFGLIGSLGIFCITNFFRLRSKEIISGVEKRKEKDFRKAEKLNLFCGISILITLFVQYTTANIFYPYPKAFDFLWGNEIFGLLIAGMAFFAMLIPYKKYFIICSILIGGLFLTI
ncbi:MAG: hypothetical protein ACTSRP_10460, partial [Candidatus Helarchaeota archaeon]